MGEKTLLNSRNNAGVAFCLDCSFYWIPVIWRILRPWCRTICTVPLQFGRGGQNHGNDVEKHRLVLHLLWYLDAARDHFVGNGTEMVSMLYLIWVNDRCWYLFWPRYLYQSLISNIFYALPWAIALPLIGITPDTAWTYHKWVLWVFFVAPVICDLMYLRLWQRWKSCCQSRNHHCHGWCLGSSVT